MAEGQEVQGLGPHLEELLTLLTPLMLLTPPTARTLRSIQTAVASKAQEQAEEEPVRTFPVVQEEDSVQTLPVVQAVDSEGTHHHHQELGWKVPTRTLFHPEPVHPLTTSTR